jgi:hypothetical protein
MDEPPLHFLFLHVAFFVILEDEPSQINVALIVQRVDLDVLLREGL